MSVLGAGEKIRDTVLSWPGVTAYSHRFGGIEYRVGRREIGHMHGDTLAVNRNSRYQETLQVKNDERSLE